MPKIQQTNSKPQESNTQFSRFVIRGTGGEDTDISVVVAEDVGVVDPTVVGAQSANTGPNHFAFQ